MIFAKAGESLADARSIWRENPGGIARGEAIFGRTRPWFSPKHPKYKVEQEPSCVFSRI